MIQLVLIKTLDLVEPLLIVYKSNNLSCIIFFNDIMWKYISNCTILKLYRYYNNYCISFLAFVIIICFQIIDYVICDYSDTYNTSI